MNIEERIGLLTGGEWAQDPYSLFLFALKAPETRQMSRMVSTGKQNDRLDLEAGLNKDSKVNSL